MNLIKPVPYHPFETQLEFGTQQIFVHFGVVVCTASNSVSNVFIPKIGDNELKKGGDPLASTHNKITVTELGVLCLDIETIDLDNYLYEKFSPLERMVPFDKIKRVQDRTSEEQELLEGTIESYLGQNFSSQDRATIFTENLGSVMDTIFFTPLVNMAAPIKNVTIRFVELDPEEPNIDIENLESFNFVVSNHKLVPIAYVNLAATKKVEQLLDRDYFFCFPFLFDSSLKESFVPVV